MKRDVMITCAVTGGADTTGKNPHVPVTADEIAKNVADVAAAGATMVHIHVRDPETGLESWRKEDFIAVVDRIRDQGTEVIINLTSAIGVLVKLDSKDPTSLDTSDFWHPEKRLEHIEAAMPDVCSLDVPIMNYLDTPYCNLPEHVRVLAGRVKEIGVKPEIEVFDTGDLWRTHDYIQEGLFGDPPLIQLCMGVRYGVPATTRGMVAMCDMLPDNCVWGAFGIGARQMPMVAQSVLMGGNVRVGLEDNLYLEKGVPATNTQLVERAVEIIERLGSNVSTVSDARKALNLRIQ